MSSTKHKRVAGFRKAVWAYYCKNGRHALPWRKTHDPYRILLSEMMLQQTQVDRVLPKYKAFLKKFPTLRALATASLADVLREWQGLGYNRRAKFLHEAAKAIAKANGAFPRSRAELIALPGIGPYTASAMRAFAWNEPAVFIETNIRTAFIHHFFPKKKKVSDAETIRLIVQSLDAKNPREWYWALMDYGAHLKKTEGNASRRSAHHVRQKPFKGSDREVRGAILKTLIFGAKTRRGLLRALPFPEVRVEKQLTALATEKMLIIRNGKVFLPN